jgi:hypothetical protein
VRFNCLEGLNVEPVFGVGVSFLAMNMDWLVPLIGVEKKRQPRIIRIVGTSVSAFLHVC